MPIHSTSSEKLQTLFDAQKQSFSFQSVPIVSRRREKLEQLADVIRKYESKIVQALNGDFGNRSSIETRSAEIASVISHIHYTLKNLSRWSKPVKMSNLTGAVPGKTYIQRQAKGVFGVISPWNYPFQLTLQPMITALAAGNKVMLKPSELTPETNAVMQELTKTVYDEAEVAWVFGEADIAAAFSQLPFDHLFYTGSTTVGRLVAIEAAKNLTPVSLELGGKSPCVMMPDADMENHAKRVAFGKFYNAGQTCVAPDYLLVPKGTSESYGKAIISFANEFYKTPSADETYTALISERSFERLSRLVKESHSRGETVLRAEAVDTKTSTKQFAPTVILNPKLDSPLMAEELFGPVLPIIEYDDIDHAVSIINEKDHPLALYVFGRDTKKASEVLSQTTSGGAMINGTILHVAIEHLPFGGVGKSGHGAYHGERGFREFSHERSVLVMPQWKFLTDVITPPYGNMIRKKITKTIAG